MEHQGGSERPKAQVDESTSRDPIRVMMAQIPEAFGDCADERISNATRFVRAVLDRLPRSEQEETLYRLISTRDFVV